MGLPGSGPPIFTKRCGIFFGLDPIRGAPWVPSSLRPQEYCGTGTGAKDVRKSVRFRTLSSSSIQIGFTGEGVCCFTLWTFVGEPSAPQSPGFHSAAIYPLAGVIKDERSLPMILLEIQKF